VFVMDETLDIAVGPLSLPGVLAIPARSRGLIIFAHGSGSSRLSPRNAYAAEKLRDCGFATLLFDLLTERESLDRRNVFDIERLARRVSEAIDWSRREAKTATMPIGLFGASTGAAAAIVAAALRPNDVAAVVSRGGRPDLAGDALARLAAPTLLIVGGEDRDVITLNREAQRLMRGQTELTIVPGAGHLFEEPGTLDLALKAAGDWFIAYVKGKRA
jgi:putative phosphoribosyl transferase